MKKLLNIFTIILAVAALALMGRAGYRFYRFSSEYAEVRNTEITSEEVKQLEAESRDRAAELADTQKELDRIREQLDFLSEAEQTGLEERIRACYVAREEAELAARSLVADALQNAHYATLTPKQQESLEDILIDEITGNAILSGAAHAAIQSASEGKSLSDIVDDALHGAASETWGYVQGEIQGEVQGAITDAIGMDIFGVTDFVSAFFNASDIPVTLVNCMVTEQRRDVYRLAMYLEKEELTGTDLQTMAALMERIAKREQEIAAAGGEVGGFGGAEQVAELAQVWMQNNYQILKYAELGGLAGED